MQFLRLSAFLLLFSSYSSFGAVIQSATTGSWNQGTTWVGGAAPGTTDDAVIMPGHTVTAGVTVTTKSIFIDAGAILSISGGVTLTVTGNVSGLGQINMTATGASLTIGGDASSFVLNAPAVATTVTYNGTGATQLIRGDVSYKNLTLSGTATKILNGTGTTTVTGNFSQTNVEFQNNVSNFVVQGTSTINNCLFKFSSTAQTTRFIGSLTGFSGGGIEMNDASHTLVLEGANNSLFSLLAAPGSTILYAGVGPQTVFPSPNYQNLVIQTPNSANLTAAIVVNGNLDIAGSATLAGGYDIDLHGNWLNNGSFNAGTASVNFVGSTAQMISGTTSTVFNRIVINNSFGLVKLNKEITSAITEINANNTLDLGTTAPNDLGTVSGTGTLALSAPDFGTTSFPWGNFSAFLAPGGTGTVEYNNLTNYTIDHSLFPGAEMYYNMVISGSGTKTLPDDARNVQNNLSIQSGVALDLTTTAPLEVFTDLINFGTLNVSAASWLKVDGSIINNAGIVINGNMEVLGNVTNSGSITGNALSGFGFSGSDNQTLTGNQPNLWDLHIMKFPGSLVSLGCNVRVDGNLIFDNDGKILLNSSDLILSPTATISTPGAFGPNRMIQSDGFPGTGRLVKEASTDAQFLGIYPIGTSAGYSPLNISTLTATLGGLSTIAMKPVMQTPPISDFIARYLQLETAVTPSDFAFDFTFVAPDKIGNPNKVYRYIGATPNPVAGEFVGATSYGILSGNGNTTINGDWKALSGSPVISSLVPSSGCIGDSISIHGSNFLGSTNVQFFSAVNAGFIVKADTLIRAKVPLGASTGNISITNPFGTGVSLSPFTVYQPPTIANAGIDSTTCVSAMNLYGNTPSVGFGTWTKLSGPATVANNPDPTSPITFSGTGLVTLKWEITNGSCPVSSDTVEITVLATPVANAGTDQTICAGESATLTATGGGTYLWSTGATTASINVTPGTTTNFDVTVSNGICTDKDTITIFVTPAPTANAGSDQAICAGNTASLNGIVTVATGGIWATSGSGTFSPSNTTLNTNYIPSGPDISMGSVTLTLTTTGAGSCTPVFDQMILTINSAPSNAIAVSPAMDTICLGLSGVITLTGSEAGVSYQAEIAGSPVGTPSAGGGNINLLIPNTDLANGPNTITISATMAGCPPVILTGNSILKKSDLTEPSISASAAGTELCNNTALNLFVTGGATYPNYQWIMNSTSMIIGATNSSYDPIVPASYRVAAYDSLCKVRSLPIDITVAAGGADPVITASSGSASIQLSTSSASPYYQWYVVSPSGSRAIYGANSNSYTAFYNADYFVAVNFNNCRLTSLSYTLGGGFPALNKMYFQMTDSVIFILPPTVEETEVALYPNPAEDAFTVNYKSSNSSVVIELFNSMGNKISSKNISDSSGTIVERFENLNLQSGIYLIYIIDGEKRVVRNVQIY